MLRKANPNYEIINDAYDRLGPTPRLCLDIASDPCLLEAYNEEVRRALIQVRVTVTFGVWQEPRNPREWMDELQDLNVHNYLDNIPNALFLIKRADIRNVESRVCAMAITDQMATRLAQNMQNNV